MASEQHGTVLPEEDQELEEDDESASDVDLEENDDVLPDEEDDNDVEEEDLNSASATATALATPTVTVAFPSSSTSTTAVTLALPSTTAIDAPDPKRLRIVETVTVHDEEKKPLPQQLDESRRLFQRLWTDEDEIELLQGFLDYTTQRGNAHHLDTALFYDQIKSKLQLDFNKNQLVEKLRRLKKKYRNVINKITSGKEVSFKTPHDQATFEISSKIWSSTTNVSVLDDEDANNNNNNNHLVSSSHETRINNNNSISNYSNNFGFVGGNNNEEKVTPLRPRKRSRSKAGGNDTVSVATMNNCENANVNSGAAAAGGSGIAGVVEETVRSCLSPLFRELLSNVMGGVVGRGIGGLAMNAVMPMGFGGTGIGMGMMGLGSSGVVVDEKWRKQQILELQVYSKRLELVQDQIKVALEELRSMGG